MTISMKSFVVLVFVVGTAICAPDTRPRREVLKGDPRYGTDYRNQHHHEGRNGGHVQIVKSVGKYAGTFSGSGPSTAGGVPFATYGPPNYQPGTPIKHQNHPPIAVYQPPPVQAPQPHHHLVPQPSQRPPAIPATSYGVPQYQYQPQPQSNYDQQSTYQVPPKRPVQFQSFGSPPVNRPQQFQRPTSNNGYPASAVEQKPVVNYEPQPQHQQQYQAPAAEHVHAGHQPQSQPQQVQFVHGEHHPHSQQVHHVHVDHHQDQQDHYAHHSGNHQQQTQQVQHPVSRPLTSYGTPVTQSPHTHEYVSPSSEASSPVPVTQEQVPYNVVHDELAEEKIRASDTFQVSPLSDSESGTHPFGNFPGSNFSPFGSGSSEASSSSSSDTSSQFGPFTQFTQIPQQFPQQFQQQFPQQFQQQFPQQFQQQFPQQFQQQFQQQFPQQFQFPSGVPQFPTNPSQFQNPFGNIPTPNSQGTPCPPITVEQINTNEGNAAAQSEASSSSSSETESSSNSENNTKSKSFPTLDLQSNSVGDFQNTGSGRSAASSGYPREQPQTTFQYVSLVTPPATESVVVEPVPQNQPTNAQHLGTSNGYNY